MLFKLPPHPIFALPLVLVVGTLIIVLLVNDFVFHVFVWFFFRVYIFVLVPILYILDVLYLLLFKHKRLKGAGKDGRVNLT